MHWVGTCWEACVRIRLADLRDNGQVIAQALPQVCLMGKQEEPKHNVMCNAHVVEGRDSRKLVCKNRLAAIRHVIPQHRTPDSKCQMQDTAQHCSGTSALSPTRKRVVRDEGEQRKHRVIERVLVDVSGLAAFLCAEALVLSQTGGSDHEERYVPRCKDYGRAHSRQHAWRAQGHSGRGGGVDMRRWLVVNLLASLAGGQ